MYIMSIMILKLNSTSSREAEAAWGLAMLLAGVAVLGKMLEGLLVGVMTGTVE
jgi:hypothetical protein